MTQAFDVAFMKPTDIKPYYRNNKVHNKRQVTLLARQIRTYGFDQPIVVDKDNVIIKGHGRWLASLELRLPLVPVVIRTDLDDDQVKASRIADNQAFALSKVDDKKSRSEVADFVSEGGVGAEHYFDFLKPEKPASNPAQGGKQVSSEAKIDGVLVTCPKCHHTQLEV